MKQSLILLLGSALLSAAWMPADKSLWGKPKPKPNHRELKSKRWLPGYEIRGVNLGAMFIIEPWMAGQEWTSMGCDGQCSEFDCVSHLGQDKANAAWDTHWKTWITTADLDEMKSYGLNTIRIPVGYWIREDIVYSDSEHFPQGGLKYLDALVGAASDRGMYIIIDHHGVPGAQQAKQPFTGQCAPTAGFYNTDYQYERAYKFLEWMTTRIHTNNAYRNVGMLEIVNEPIQNSAGVGNMISTFYPNAWKRIRAAEDAANIAPNNRLHIQMMDQRWGSGDPNADLPDLYFAAYDDHRYLKYDPSVAKTPAAYLAASCSDDVSGNWPLVVGEWSLSVATDVQSDPDFDPGSNKAWYAKWFAAQVLAYEKQAGWVFWAWKAQLGDLRWSYREAVAAGVVTTDLDSVKSMDPC